MTSDSDRNLRSRFDSFKKLIQFSLFQNIEPSLTEWNQLNVLLRMNSNSLGLDKSEMVGKLEDYADQVSDGDGDLPLTS